MTEILKGKHGPLLIAEIGGNHEGDFAYAERLTDLALATDVDVVKFQIYTGDSLVSRQESPQRNQHFKKFELRQEQHLALARKVEAAGKIYAASVWDLEAMDWLDAHLPFYKIGSGDLTAYPVLEATAQRGKPIVLSTGLATQEEVLATVRFLQAVDPRYRQPEYLALLQCTSMYPIPEREANLNVINRLRELTGLSVGYSDHTEGLAALQYAVAMGAEILEFHFTDRREGQSFRDHKVSLLPAEVEQLIAEIGRIRTLQGTAVKAPTESELRENHPVSFRRAVYPRQGIQKGEVLSAENLTVLRPNHGLDARHYQSLMGSAAAQELGMHEKITPGKLGLPEPAGNCPLCGSLESLLRQELKAKPAGETPYLPEDEPYYRQIRECLHCGVFFNAHGYDLFGADFYTGRYNAAIEAGKLRQRFERIVALPQESSDNQARSRRILNFSEIFMPQALAELRLLDVGSGTGVFPYAMAQHPLQVSAVDPDPAAVALMREKIPNASVYQGSIDAVPEAEKFHLITFNKVLEHLVDLDGILHAAQKRLAPGGVFYLELPFGEDLAKAGLEAERAEFFIEHFTTYTYPAMHYLARRFAWRILALKHLVEPSGKHTIFSFVQPQAFAR